MLVLERGKCRWHALSVQGRATVGHSLWSPSTQSTQVTHLSRLNLAGPPSLLHWLLSWSVLLSSSVVTVGGSVTVCLCFLQPLSSFLKRCKPHFDSWENGSLSQTKKPWTHWNLCRWNWEMSHTHRIDCITAALHVRAYASGGWIWPTSTRSSAITRPESQV